MRARAALLVLAVLPFAPGILQGHVFFRRDVHLMWYTQVETMAAAVLEGAWPLWNPYMAFGQPLWADANTQPLYPTTLLHLFLKPWNWYTLYVVLHVWLAGWGTARLLRRLRASTFASFVGGAVFMACGPLLSLVDTWNQLAGAAWVPWAALSALDALHRPSSRRVAVWALCLAAPVLAGSPEGLLMGLALSAACGWARLGVPRTLAAWQRLAGVAAAATVLGALLSAGQWLPSLEATSRSNRAALSPEARAHWAIAPAVLPQVVLPLPLHVLPLRPDIRQRLFGGHDPFLPSLYLGLPALALVTAPVVRRGRRIRGTLVVLAMGALLVALGPFTPLAGLASSALPVLQSLRYPSKAMILVAVCWALLAGLGADAWMRAIQKGGLGIGWIVVPALIGTGVAAMGAALSLARGEPGIVTAALLLPEGLPSAAILYPLLRALTVVGVLSLAMSTAFLAASRGFRPALLALGLLPIMDLQLAHRGLNPMAPRTLYTHRPAVLSAVEREGERVFVYDYFEPGASQKHLRRTTPYLPARAPEGWGLPAAHALGLRQYLFPPSGGAWRVAGSFERDVSLMGPLRSDRLRVGLLRAEGSPGLFLRRLQAGGVRTVVALHDRGLEPLQPVASFDGLFAEPIRVFRVPGAVARTYLAAGRRVREPEAAAVAPEFDILHEVALAQDEDGFADPVAMSTRGVGELGTSRVLLASADRLRLGVSATRPAYVVAVDAYDPHWSATVDGVPARIELANGAFRAVLVPAGAHVVEMVYRPWPVFAGLGLSTLGTAAAAVLWRRSARKARR